MGTSTSNSGPPDRPALLPKWALEPLDPPPGDTPPPEKTADDLGDADAADQGANDTTVVPPPDASNGPIKPTPIRKNWQTARRRIGKVVGTGGDRDAIGHAGRAYLRALGGSRRAAKAATTGRSATARLGRFLADVATRGLTEAAKRIGIGSVVGQDTETVLAAVLDAIAPASDTPRDVAARGAVLDALLRLYDQLAVASANPTDPNTCTAKDVRAAIELSVVAYVYHRWLQDVGKTIEQKGTSPGEAARIEREIKRYVKASVQLDLDDVDALTFNWSGREGRSYLDRKFQEAYSIFEAT